ncbi:MAG: general secretion pathway protein I [Halieaceae bacterium]|jgi:general secretion pathway protein I
MSVRRPAGFTLIEVMVALVIVSFALPALLVTVYRQVDGVGYLRDKSLAGYVAANQLTEARLLLRGSAEFGEGKDSGVEEMASRNWYWWTERKKTSVENMFKVTVTVAAQEQDEKEPMVSLVGFVAAPSGTVLGLEGDNPAGPQAGE